jgi:hypothetical protein
VNYYVLYVKARKRRTAEAVGARALLAGLDLGSCSHEKTNDKQSQPQARLRRTAQLQTLNGDWHLHNILCGA